MDIDGYRKIITAVQGDCINPNVLPEPSKNEDLRFLCVTEEIRVNPATVLNALDKAGLINRDGDNQLQDRTPKLRYMGTVVSSEIATTIHSFEDTSVK